MSSSSRGGAVALAVALAACGGGASPTAGFHATTPPPPPSGGNALRVTVDGALCTAGLLVNEPCVSITLCTPDQVQCQVVSGLLLDTGSFGLRVFKEALTVSLPLATSAGRTLATCARFGDGSSQWGPVANAAVLLGQEAAVRVPVQIVDAGFSTPPSTCTQLETSAANAGFNGILGVGPFVADCGPTCAALGNGVYFTCTTTACSGAAVPEAAQVQNPAALLGADGAGLVVHLPAVPVAGVPSAEGEVRLGIATASNNQPSGVTSMPLDAYGEFSAAVMGQGFAAFTDTGSNGLFFNPPPSVTSLPPCASLPGWYCPTSTLHFNGTATPTAGGAAAPFAFDVANFASLTSGFDAVFPSAAGTGLGSNLFDLGLPFFLGRDVWIVFDGKTSTLGTGPLVAF